VIGVLPPDLAHPSSPTSHTHDEPLREFMRFSPLLAFMKDEEGRYVYVNPRMEREFGISSDAICGKADVDWLPDQTAKTVQENDRQVLATGKTIEVVETLPGHDGQLRHWLVNKFLFTRSSGERFVGGLGMDVTALKVAESRLSQSEERYRHLVEHSQGLICTHDATGRILSANPAALKQLGYDADELVGRSLEEILSPNVRAEFPRYLERILSRGEDAGLMLVIARDGALRTWRYHNVCTHDEVQGVYVLGHAQDVTELRDAQEHLRTLAHTDELTGLLNRRGFMGRASRYLQKCLSTNLPVTAFYADVDQLKHVNDTLGHEAGSTVIAAAAEALSQTFRAADVLGRIGGDEFAVLAQISPTTTLLVERRLEDHVRGINDRGALPAPLALTIGWAHLHASEPTTLEELIRFADQNMYARKRPSAR
jgi:diguanylate cyclase (GGDEF)-like protein/PAS domain S-box-containing protein